MIPLLLALVGCGAVPETRFEGTVAGRSLTDVGTAYFGGPFVIFTDAPLDCIDVAWVTRYYDEEVPPTDTDLTGLQITFFDDDVRTGRYDLSGEAAVGVRLLVVDGDDFTVLNGREGTLTVDEVTDEEAAFGTLDVDFGEEGSLSASWAAQWCVNVSE